MLSAKVIRADGPGMGWSIRNTLRISFLWGLLTTCLAVLFSRLTGIPTVTSNLQARLIRKDGKVVNFGIVSRRVVTTAGVTYLCADWNTGTNDITNLNYHGCGTGVTAEAIGDTALVTECTTALNPDSTRSTGTKSNPSGNQLQTVGTCTFDASAAVAEHGIFTQAATGGGTLWDRSQFTAINVANGDSIQFTYTVTFNAGG
jgi:hypothetical protein